MPVRHALPIALILLLTLFGVVATDAQTIVVYNVDASGFPTITANIAVLDAQGRRLTNVSAADLSIVEDGLPDTAITISCPPLVPPLPFNAVLVNDRSGSMTIPLPGGGGLTRMDLAKLGSSEFVRATDFTSGSSIAVTSFESVATIVSDFRTSALPLLDAIATISASGGTLYNPPFLDPLAGAIGMLASRPEGPRRVIVFLTDGEPNEPTLTMEIIAAARDAGIEIHTVTLGMPMTGPLRTMSELTGGLSFGDVSTVEQMRGVYQQIAIDAGGNEPCDLSFRSRVRCGPESRARTATITHTPSGASTRVRFMVPERGVGGFAASPSFVHFGPVGPPEQAERAITIVAPNDSMRVDRFAVVPEGAFTVVDWGGSAPPFREGPGISRTIRVRFTPADSQKYVASLVLYGAPCPPLPITLTGGVGTDEGNSLRLLAPLGGESFAGCDSILIRWGGVAPTTPIDIDASNDDGATWRRIATGATGLEYRWMAPTPGDRWRIRITSKEGSDQHIITSLAGGGASEADSIPASAAVLYSPTGVAVRGDEMFIAESGQHRIRRVDMTTGLITTIAGDGNPGSNGAVVARLARLNGPSHVLLYGTYLFIADRDNHRVRRINLRDGLIYTVAGTGASGFSGDSADALMAELQYPSYLAVSGSRLYITDAGNLRVRRVDFSSGEIITIAGGGVSTADDIAATNALLQAPAGITADNDYLYIAEDLGRRIRRVDLRTGLITTVAGTGAFGSTGDGGQASVATFMRPLGVKLIGERIYVTDTAAHRIRVIDLVTGVIETIAGTGAAGFGGDGGDARLARMNAPGQPDTADGYLHFPDIHNGRARAISIGRGPGADSSRSAFAVSVSGLEIRPSGQFDLGAMAVGQPRDSAIAAALCNVGDRPLVIESYTITGPHAADFRVVSGAPSAEIAPGECIALEVRFRPSALGARAAMLILQGRCANADTIMLAGTGVDTCGARTLELADVGEIVLGAAARDTIVTRAICNAGDRTLTGNARIVDGAGAFAIVDGGGAFTIAPGACHTVTVRFSPSLSGRVTGAIDYGIPSVCGTAMTRLFGRALGSPELSTPLLVTLPSELCGTSLDTSITIVNTGGAPLEITGAAFIANDEGFSLLPPMPSPGAPRVVAPGESATLAMRFAPASTGDKRATLELLSNAADAPTRVELRGRREQIDVAATPMVSFPDDGRPFPRDTTVVVRNTGSVDIELVSASLNGDVSSYDVPAAQFPIAIAAGAEAGVAVRLLDAPGAAALRARLTLAYGPTCDSGRIAIDLLAAGTGPELLLIGPDLLQLVCPDDVSRDTTIWLRNEGNDTLVITGVSIGGTASASFSVDAVVPFSIAPSDDTTLTVRFAASIAGDYTAELAVESNSSHGTEWMMLIGRRERLELASVPGRITLTGDAPGTPLNGSVIVANNGTVAMGITVTSMHGLVTVAGGANAIGAGGTAAFTLRHEDARGGRFFDTLIVRESTCGTELRIPVEIVIGLPSVARLTLPRMTARPGELVLLPISIAIVDAARFAASGARGYTATVSMYGTVVVPDGVTGATMTGNDYDMATRRQRVTFSGDYDGGAMLAAITGRTLLGDTLGTPLSFESFAWDVQTVGAELVDGALTIVGSCLDLGLRLVAVPSILKLRPMPASDAATLELSLEEWNDVTVVLYDALGMPAHRLVKRGLEAGTQWLPLDLSGVPAGAYTLAVETPYGRSVMPIVVAR